MVSWPAACLEAVGKPLQFQFDSARASCGATVRRALAIKLCCLFFVLLHRVMHLNQIVAYCACALASSFVIYVLRQMKDEDRRYVWRLYGWFNWLMLCGSCFGAVTWSTRIKFLEFIFKTHDIINSYESSGETYPNASIALKHSFEARAFEWRAAFSVTYPIEFMFLSAAKLMVLDRMLDFAAPQEHVMRDKLMISARMVMSAVILGNVFGIVANAVAAAYYTRAADAADASSAQYYDGNTTQGAAYYLKFQQQLQQAILIGSYQAFAEVAVLLLIVAAFVVCGVLCAHRVSSRVLGAESTSVLATAGRRLWLQIVGTSAFVFVAFLLRSAFSVMHAVAQWRQDLDNPNNCTDSRRCDPQCFNSYTQMTIWMLFTPQFQMTIVFISSPLALLVALWGMTSKRTIRLIKSSRRDLANERAAMLRS